MILWRNIERHLEISPPPQTLWTEANAAQQSNPKRHLECSHTGHASETTAIRVYPYAMHAGLSCQWPALASANVDDGMYQDCIGPCAPLLGRDAGDVWRGDMPRIFVVVFDFLKRSEAESHEWNIRFL